ncbi:MAG: hypothetical protein ACLQAH_12205 [Limisphaerales bacterium]
MARTFGLREIEASNREGKRYYFPDELSGSGRRPPCPEEGFNLMQMDRWFLTQIKEIVDFKKHPAAIN